MLAAGVANSEAAESGGKCMFSLKNQPHSSLQLLPYGITDPVGLVLKRSQKSRFLCVASLIFSVAIQFEHPGPPKYLCVLRAACSRHAL